MQDKICSECEIGGNLLCCDGPCKRSFHLECLKMKKVPDGEIWYCSDCAKKEHRCFGCGKYEKDENLVSCNLCGRFFHLEDDCTGESCVWHPPDDDGMPVFVCGSHVCYECGRENANARCFHLGCKCVRAFLFFPPLCLF